MDELFAHGGQTLAALCAGKTISRQAVSKHLAQLERAGLVVTHRAGREKLHYLNPVPLQEIAERWIAKYQQAHVAAIAALKHSLTEDEQ